MRNTLVRGSFLVALLLTGCVEIRADLECGKNGKVRGDLAVVFYGSEDYDLSDLSCEEEEYLREEVKVAIGESDNKCDVVFAEKYKVKDVNCDGYPDVVAKFDVKELVCAGLLNQDTTELFVALWVECEFYDGGWVDVESCEEDCDKDSKEEECEEDSKEDCEESKEEECEEESTQECEKDSKEEECEEQTQEENCEEQTSDNCEESKDECEESKDEKSSDNCDEKDSKKGRKGRKGKKEECETEQTPA
jgi:hypothetical protein